MKKQIFRVLCCIMVVAMLVGGTVSLASCKKDKEGENDGPLYVPPSDDETADPNSEEELFRPGDVKFDSYEYKILSRTNNTDNKFNLYVYEGDGSPTEVVDYALFCRQALMEERHGVIMVAMEDLKATSILSNEILAETPDYCHGAALPVTDWAVLATNGYLFDLKTLDGLNLEASYWDQRIQKEFDVNGHLFALEGEYSCWDDLVSFVILYNDTVYERLGYDTLYGSPYELAAQNKWTYEMMMTLIKDVSHELDGDDTLNEDDFWGFLSETPAPYYFFLGSGQKYIINNEDGIPVFAAHDATVWEKNYDVLADLMKMGTNKDILMINRDIGGENWAKASQMFITNRALFRSTALAVTLDLLNMEDDYGIMPIPHYSEEQTEYYCMCSGEPFVIPVCVTEPEKAAQVIDMISYYSLYMGGDSLNYAFYDLLAFARLCRTEDDVNMLKLVFANKTYDLDYAAGLTKVRNNTSNMVLRNEYTNLYSDLTSLKESSNTKIQDFVLRVEAQMKK